MDLVVRRRDTLAEMNRILKVEEIFWHQKAKCKWLQEGDRNTKFFYKLVNGRKRNNLIPRLVVDGVEVVIFEDIADEAIQFFSNLYKKDLGSRLVIANLFQQQLLEEQMV